MTLKLVNGAEIPALGLGVWQTPDGAECERAVSTALEAGYRLIDTAQDYRNEVSVGKAIRASGIPREEIFLTTKFRPVSDDPYAAAEQSLERLGLDYVDLYLVHWPQGGPTWAWPGMEKAAQAGFAKAIGVSNFSATELAELAKVAELQPALNQVYFSPFAYRRALLEAGTAAGLVTQAYSPLGTGDHLTDPTVGRIATEVGKTPAQVLIRWGLQKGLSVIPKSANPDRIRQNFAVDFELGDAAVAELDALDRTGGTAESNEHKWW
ncbi:aldo/keto reductase [Kribbella yunnanensis]|uniref:Aldo/keto reductase n=1 Tax=Kribbella yunnanensis TaxID=190194 RepID=A0ABN2GV52_9ACTN